MSEAIRRQVMITRVEEEPFRRMAGLLRSSGMDVHRARWDDTTLELVQSIPFDSIIVGFPVPNDALERVLDAARAEGSPCRRSGLILVADPDHGDNARALIGRGANRVVTTDLLNRPTLSLQCPSPCPRLSPPQYP